MTAGRGSEASGAAGGLARHVPVLGAQAVEWLSPRAGGIYVDGTFGAGGYTRLILAVPDTRVIGIDRDRSAITGGYDLVQQSGGRLSLVQDTISNLDDAVRDTIGRDGVDGVVFDFGVSSMQLDQAERGFSFRLDGPLDMRMGVDDTGGEGPSAADVIATASEKSLAAIFAILGEERFARPVARAIVKARAETRITTTGALADVIGRIIHQRPGEIHPATRTFQGLRIFVNDELNEIRRALAAAERILKPDGRLVAVSFHSLEDRIVKSFFTERGKASAGSRHLPERDAPPPTFLPLTKKPEVADADEVARNPRARSAKLRAAVRTNAPPRMTEFEDDERLPTLAAVMEGK